MSLAFNVRQKVRALDRQVLIFESKHLSVIIAILAFLESICHRLYPGSIRHSYNPLSQYGL